MQLKISWIVKRNYLNRATVTADMLWDYVEGDFAADNMRFAAVTERYNSYRLNVEHQGRTEFAVFKRYPSLECIE